MNNIKKLAKSIILYTIICFTLSSYTWAQEPNTTTFIFIRHAETTGEGHNPNLSKKGKERANSLKGMLSGVELDAIYSTDYNRTMQNSSPIAKDKNMSVTNYNPSELNKFIDILSEKHTNKTVLIVGHSNTTPTLLNIILGNKQYDNIPEDKYNNMYIVTIGKNSKPEIVNIKYGSQLIGDDAHASVK